MARSFNGSSDYLTGTAGALVGMDGGPITLAAVVKLNTTTDDGALIYCGGGSESGVDLEIFGGSYYMASQDPALAAASTADNWHLVVATKAAGTQTPRFHKYVYDTATWTHANAGSTQGDGVAVVAGNTLQIGRWGTASDRINASIAVVAAWDRVLTDAEVEQLAYSYRAWQTSSPKVLIPLWQATATTNIVDETGGGGNITGGTGTSVSTSSSPFSLGDEVIIPHSVPAAAGTNVNPPAAAGTGTAHATTTQVAPTAGVSSGSGAAGGVTTQLSTGTGVAGATGAAGGPGAQVSSTAGLAAGTGTANAAVAGVAAGTGEAGGTGTAGGPGAQVSTVSGSSAGVGAANAASAQVAPHADVALGSGTANAATVVVGTVANAGEATGVGTAEAITTEVAPGAASAEGVGAALGVTAGIASGTGVAGGTGAAGASGSAVGSTPSTALGAGSAFDATVQLQGSANAGIGVGSGAAGGPGSGVAPSADAADEIGTALGATVSTSGAGTTANAQLASGVGSAFTVTINITATAGVAAGVGTAPQPSAQEEGDVHLYKFGPCEPWTPTWPTGNDCNVLLLTGAAAVTGIAVQAASEILYQLTAQRFGLCSVKLRPCRQACSATFPWSDWWEYGTYPQPYWWSGTWYNLACGSCPNDSCSCVGLEQTVLPGPVYDVVEVKVNGVVLTKNVNYRIDDYRKLVRIDGELWPFCQNMNLADTEVDTWSVTVDYGEVVPALGSLAIGELAAEIVKYLLCQDCQLPQGVVDISRQGISMSVAQVSDLFNTGFIQLRMCDLLIKTANPNHLAARSSVYDLDGPQHRAWGTTP